MYVKKGKLIKKNESEEPFIETKDGKVYKVTFIVAFIWEKLDGETSLEAINKMIKNFSKDEEVQNPLLNTISQQVVEELLQVDLVKLNTKESVSQIS